MCKQRSCFKASHPQPSYFNFSIRKAFFPKVDAASQLADNSKDDMPPEAAAEAAADDIGDDGKRKKKKEKIGFRDRKVKIADIFQFFKHTQINIYIYLGIILLSSEMISALIHRNST